MTNPAIITASYAAERNYSHNPDDVIDASDAVGAWGTAKESTTELVDLSGHNNKAAIKGPMPTEGFIQGRRFEGIDDYLDCGNDSSLDFDINDFSIHAILKFNTIEDEIGILGSPSLNPGYNLMLINNALRFYTRDAANGILSADILYSNLDVGVIYDIWGMREGSLLSLYVNNVLVDTVDGPIRDVTSPSNYTVGKSYNFFMNGVINSIMCYNYSVSIADGEDFNTLARLPFWSVNYTDYPDNVTEYTDNLPYSSSIISSGTFKVDDDKLQCVSAGTMTYSASYDFDGSEYIKVEISGVEYAGIGTITQGNTTVSVAQGSNKITIQAGTGDTINEIHIQFRKVK